MDSWRAFSAATTFSSFRLQRRRGVAVVVVVVVAAAGGKSTTILGRKRLLDEKRSRDVTRAKVEKHADAEAGQRVRVTPQKSHAA